MLKAIKNAVDSNGSEDSDEETTSTTTGSGSRKRKKRERKKEVREGSQSESSDEERKKFTLHTKMKVPTHARKRNDIRQVQAQRGNVGERDEEVHE